tara:strand:+ start:473 stop:676 length:204 start_codon:yes stop_codon:yes gene_type:complete
MENFLMLMLGISLLSVLVVLFLGLIVFVKGGNINEKYGNKLMQLRVFSQSISIILIIILVAVRMAAN